MAGPERGEVDEEDRHGDWGDIYDIAGYRKSVVSVNRTAYHGYFEFLRLETGFEQLSGGCTVLEGGAATKRNGLIFMRWTHIDLGAQDFNGIQRPKSFFQNSHK